MSAGQRLRVGRSAARRLELGRAREPAVGIFLWSRAAIWAAAIFAFAWFEPNRHALADRWDVAENHDLGWALDVWARWDSGWYLRIAESGYAALPDDAAAFFPLYPALVGLAGRALAGHYVLGGIVVSLAAALASFVLLWRLAEPRIGADGARRAVLYLAVFPTALFLQAVYGESLFLALALGAFLAAERSRWPLAGVAAGLALLTRPAGLALLPALALLAWRAPQRRRALASLALAPALFAIYPLMLWNAVGDPFAFLRAQGTWSRSLSPFGPLGGIAAGIRDALTGHVPAGAAPLHAVAVNVQGILFLALFVALAVVAWRRFGAPYGLYAACGLALPLSVPSDRWPLLSLPRFGLVLFPLFLALAVVGREPRVHTAILVVSSLLLGVATVQWALWQWVA